MNGNLIAVVTLANQSIPVKDAVVTVTMADGDKQILLGVRRTDENGKTAPVEVTTPNAEYSLEPGNGVKPYTSVDVRVDHPAAYTVIVRNAQVFSDNTSLVNVSLIPLSDGVKSGTQEIIEVTPQNL